MNYPKNSSEYLDQLGSILRKCQAASCDRSSYLFLGALLASAENYWSAFAPSDIKKPLDQIIETVEALAAIDDRGNLIPAERKACIDTALRSWDSLAAIIAEHHVP